MNAHKKGNGMEVLVDLPESVNAELSLLSAENNTRKVVTLRGGGHLTVSE